jgi:hypothetical protein
LGGLHNGDGLDIIGKAVGILITIFSLVAKEQSLWMEASGTILSLSYMKNAVASVMVAG